MTDVFAKAVADLKLGDFAGDVPAPPKLQQPSSLDILREQGVAGGTRPAQRRNIDVVGDLIRMERNKKSLAKLQGANAAAVAIPSWTDATTKIAGFDALPYDQQKKLHDEYVQRAVAEMAKADPKTDALLHEQKVLAQAPAPVDPTGGKGDFARGLAQRLPQAKGLAASALGYALTKLGNAETGKQFLDIGKDFDAEAGKLGKVNDSFTEALKPEGSLADWFQYQAGQAAGNFVEALATAAVGGVVGGAASGGLAAVPGAAVGFVGKTLVKKKLRDLIEKEVGDSVENQVKNGIEREVAEKIAREAAEVKLRKATGKALGQIGTLYGYSVAQGTGEIVQQAREAGIDPTTLGLGRTLGTAAVYGLAETLSDKIMLGAFGGTTGGAVKRTLKRGVGTAVTEGSTEVAQDTLTKLAGAGVAPEFIDLINAFAAGAAGGGIVGGTGALLRGTPSDPAATATPDPNAPVELTDEELAAAPADTATIPAGTLQEIEGATLVMGANGQWAYAEGQTPNPIADLLVQSPPSAPVVDPVSEGTLDTTAGADFNVTPTQDEQDDALLTELGAAAPTVEMTPDGDVQIAGAPTDPVAVFNTKLAEAASNLKINPYAQAALSNFAKEAAPLIEQLAEGISTGVDNPNARAQLTPMIGKLWDTLNSPSYGGGGSAVVAINEIVNAMPVGDISPTAANVLPYVFKQLGVLNGVEASQSPWALEARKPGATTEGVLLATAADTSVGQTRQASAKAVYNIFQVLGRPFPKLSLVLSSTENWWKSNGTIQLGRLANASTLTHEAVHDLTVAGWGNIHQRAKNGNVDAINVVALMTEIREAMIKAAAGTKYYALKDNYDGNMQRNTAELMADFFEPGFLALASQTAFDPSTLSPQAQAGLKLVQAQGGATASTIADIIRQAVAYIIRALSPDTLSLAEANSAATALVDLTTYAIMETSNPKNPDTGPDGKFVLPELSTPAPAPAPAPAPKPTVDEALGALGVMPQTLTLATGQVLTISDSTQKGSNPGATYIGSNSGWFYYVKRMSLAQAENEMAAALLYREAGVVSPRPQMIKADDSTAYFVSRIPQGGVKPMTAAEMGNSVDVAYGFLFDAWLANWDVVGLGYDNIVRHPDGEAMRIDFGGALEFRAQGAPKGTMFGPVVNELDTLRDPSINPQAAKVFANVFSDPSLRAQVEAALERLELSVTEDVIKGFAFSPELTEKLIARRTDVIKKAQAKLNTVEGGVVKLQPLGQTVTPPAPGNATQTATSTDWSSFTAPPSTKLKALKPSYFGHPLVWPDTVTKAIYMVGKPGKALKPVHYPIIAWLDAVGIPPSQVSTLYKQILASVKAQVKQVEKQTKDPSKKKTATVTVPSLGQIVTSSDATLSLTADTALDAILKQEFAATEAKYGGTAAWQAAGKAGKTVLDYRAWVQVRTPRFLQWFGNWMDGTTLNKLTLDKATGEPRQYYRGVPKTYFKAFNEDKGRSFFTSVRKMAETYGGETNKKVYPVFLRAPDAYEIQGNGEVWNNVPLSGATQPAPGMNGSTDNIFNYAKSKGFKTVYFHDILDYISNNQKGVHTPGDVVIITSVVDAKSSTANSGEFATNADVTDIFNEPGDAYYSETAEAPVVDNDLRPGRRASAGATIDDMSAGVPASASTPGRGLIQAAKAKDMDGVSKARNAFGERLNEELHDASVRMKRWLESLPESDILSNLLKQSVIGSMYRARKIRDDILRRMYDDQLAGIDAAVVAFADKHKLSTETATRDIGYITTAKTIPARNAWLLRKRVKALAELQAQVDAELAAQQTAPTAGMVPAAVAAAASAPTQETKLEELQKQLALAQKSIVELVAAINNPSTHVKKHGGGGVAGMNNAQAAAILSGLRTRYGDAAFADIEAIAGRIYDMNAVKLALDIESGKVAPAVAADFLERPAALKPMQELRALANAVNAENKASVDALEAKRKEVITAVRTEYVPLSGDPTKDIDDASFHGGSGIPNVQRDYALQGRERGALPDDGLSTSRAALMKSASYTGWRDFQDGIAAIHAAMTKEERDAFGIHAQTVEPGRSTLSNKAVIRHRNGKTTAYFFDDETLVDAIRGASRLENNFLLEGAGKITKLYSYLATQANPFFAPFNFIRDSWERSEFIRTRTYLRANGSAADASSISNGMLKYLVDPELMRATGRYAMGKPVDTSSRAGRYLDEFLRQGGVSVFSSQFGADRAKIIAQINRQKSWRQQLGTLDRWISTYNKTFDVGPSLASFMAMRDAGMSPKDAAAGALDLMDFGKRGKSASVFGSIYAFAQPTFTGAANAISAIRDPKTGRMNPVGVARLGGYVVGFLMLQAFLRSMADEDEGGNKLDQQSGFTKNNFLLIPYGEDGMIKVPLAYGLTRVANGIARAALGVGTNEQTPTEALGKFVSGSVIPVFSPIEDSDIDWFERPAQALLTLFAPSWLKPPLALATNTTPFDTQIINSKYADPTKFKSEQFGKYAPESYKDMARSLRQLTGIDMAPEEIRYLLRAYPLGVGQLAIQGPLEDKTFGDAAQRKVYANYSEFARYFQFKAAINETDDLLKRSKAGEAIDGTMDRQKLAWRLQWDAQDKALRSEKAAATRAAKKLSLTKEGQADAVDGMFGDKRMAAQVRALYYYRLMQGKDATIGAPVEAD